MHQYPPNVSRSSSSTQAQLLLSTSSIPTAFFTQSLNHLFQHLMTHLPLMICLPLLEHLPQSYPLPRPTLLFNHPLHLIYRIPRKSQKSEREKKEKRNTEKMKDTVFEIKMAQHRPRKPASVEYTTDEEDTIVYDMGEEIESPKNGSTVGESKKDIAKYTCITPTKYKK
ncbi:hypothetical protein TNCV_99991 [Trichonephila clavipes]|nr:hypothetical protein TNCV_99991 [Trichonephila clavipes]